MFESLKQPEYIGENRCPPCTVVNAAIAVALGAVPMLIPAFTEIGGSPTAPVPLAAAGAILAASLATIYFRGYLLPGTPTLTKRYLPDRILGLFDKVPEPAPTGVDAGSVDESGEEVTEDDLDPEEFLLAVGAVEPCEDSRDLCLTDGFQEAWSARIEDDREEGIDAEKLTGRLGAPEDEYEIKEYHSAWILRNSDRHLGQWPSRAALLADGAAAATLSEWTDRWESLSLPERSELIAGLRVFLEDCPTGDGKVSFDEETVSSCCRERTVLTLSCEETGERLLELPAPEGN